MINKFLCFFALCLVVRLFSCLWTLLYIFFSTLNPPSISSSSHFIPSLHSSSLLLFTSSASSSSSSPSPSSLPSSPPTHLHFSPSTSLSTLLLQSPYHPSPYLTGKPVSVGSKLWNHTLDARLQLEPEWVAAKARYSVNLMLNKTKNFMIFLRLRVCFMFFLWCRIGILIVFSSFIFFISCHVYFLSVTLLNFSFLSRHLFPSTIFLFLSILLCLTSYSSLLLSLFAFYTPKHYSSTCTPLFCSMVDCKK